MINNNTIKFGYGDVTVASSNLLGTITFTYIKPPLEVGTALTEKIKEDIEVVSKITFSEDMPFEFKDLMDTVTEENKVIAYKGYVLDFSNYNEDSVNIVRKHAKNMVNLMALAC